MARATKRTPEQVERLARTVQLRREGMTFAEIGADLGISTQRASQLYSEAVLLVPVEQVEEHRREQAEIAAEAVSDLIEIARDQSNSPRDRTGAWAEIRGWQARLAKLYGTDAPTAVRAELVRADLEDEINRRIGMLGEFGDFLTLMQRVSRVPAQGDGFLDEIEAELAAMDAADPVGESFEEISSASLEEIERQIAEARARLEPREGLVLVDERQDAPPEVDERQEDEGLVDGARQDQEGVRDDVVQEEALPPFEWNYERPAVDQEAEEAVEAPPPPADRVRRPEELDLNGLDAQIAALRNGWRR